MNIEIKKSIKPINYDDAINLLEKRLEDIKDKERDLIWILEHDEIFTAGTSYKENEILDKTINYKNKSWWKNYLSWSRSINLLFCYRFKKKKKILENL